MPAPSARRAAAFSGAAILLLAACQSAPPRPAAAPIGFAQFAPIVLDVAAVRVVDARRVPANAADGRIPTPPMEAVRRWAADRLRAGGRAGTATVTVRDASVTETQLPRTGGVRGLFTNDQAQRYDGRIDVEVTAERPGESSIRAFTRATVTQSATVPEDIALADREATLQALTRRMAEDLNARLDAGIRSDLAALVLR